jgi:DNA (cytosine-5)-methyltransferase 1
MMKPRLLDLFSCAGGAGAGYAKYFDVTGVDHVFQPHYPFRFIQADALTFLDTADLSQFDVIHASPPCQGYSRSRHIRMSRADCIEHPLLLGEVREHLIKTGLPWIMENVAEAPMPHFLMLCGTMFGLKVYRHRQFESSHLMFSPGPCQHPHELLPGYVCVYGHHTRGRQIGRYGNNYQRYPVEVGRIAMDIDWMTQAELSQAIPPAYTRWIGQFLYDAVMQEREVAI